MRIIDPAEEDFPYSGRTRFESPRGGEDEIFGRAERVRGLVVLSLADAPGAPALAVADGVVRFEDVRFAYDSNRPILHGVSFEIPAGKTVAVVGPSGSGKSTLARLLLRLIPASAGQLLFDGQDITALPPARLAKKGIGRTFQNVALFSNLSVLDNTKLLPAGGVSDLE